MHGRRLDKRNIFQSILFPLQRGRPGSQSAQFRHCAQISAPAACHFDEIGNYRPDPHPVPIRFSGRNFLHDLKLFFENRELPGNVGGNFFYFVRRHRLETLLRKRNSYQSVQQSVQLSFLPHEHARVCSLRAVHFFSSQNVNGTKQMF